MYYNWKYLLSFCSLNLFTPDSSTAEQTQLTHVPLVLFCHLKLSLFGILNNVSGLLYSKASRAAPQQPALEMSGDVLPGFFSWLHLTKGEAFY